MRQTVIGLFDDSDDARDAIEKLKDKGFSEAQVDCSYAKRSEDATTRSSGDNNGDHDNAITKFFKNLFGDDDDEADRYSRASYNRTIVSVHCESSEEAARAAEILDDEGAIDVNEHGNTYGMERNNMMSADGSSDSRNLTEEQRIPIVEENLEVGKREVTTGGVSVRSRIVERPVEESIRLRNERVWVERTPVDREATTDADSFRERSIELTEKAEVPVVNKESRVVEEVRVGKETTHTEKTIKDNLKKTEVDIDKKGRRSDKY